MGLEVASGWSKPGRHERGHHEALSRFLCEAMVEECGPDFSTYDLANRIGMSQGTAWKLLSDVPNEFRELTLQNVAKAFGPRYDIDIRDVRMMAGQPAGELEPYVPPLEVNQLSHRQRALIDDYIFIVLAAQGRKMTR